MFLKSKINLTKYRQTIVYWKFSKRKKYILIKSHRALYKTYNKQLLLKSFNYNQFPLGKNIYTYLFVKNTKKTFFNQEKQNSQSKEHVGNVTS